MDRNCNRPADILLKFKTGINIIVMLNYKVITYGIDTVLLLTFFFEVSFIKRIDF